MVAARVRELRKRRDWSVRQLADRCAELGISTLTENALENIERGRSSKALRQGRAVTADELVALAYALDVAPTALLLPAEFEPSTEYQVTPTLSVAREVLVSWLDVRLPLDQIAAFYELKRHDEGLRREHDAAWGAVENARFELFELMAKEHLEG